jgi:hypothetical protein
VKLLSELDALLCFAGQVSDVPTSIVGLPCRGRECSDNRNHQADQRHSYQVTRDLGRVDRTNHQCLQRRLQTGHQTEQVRGLRLPSHRQLLAAHTGPHHPHPGAGRSMTRPHHHAKDRKAFSVTSYGPVLAGVAATVVLALGVIAALNQLEIASITFGWFRAGTQATTAVVRHHLPSLLSSLRYRRTFFGQQVRDSGLEGSLATEPGRERVRSQELRRLTRWVSRRG